ncbi:MAG: YbaN family protein [Bacteroidales bacterium]
MSYTPLNRKPLSGIKKWLLIISGSVSLGLGTLGVIIPLLPTTPFLLLTAACYIRSSERLYKWLMNHPVYGESLMNYINHRAITLNVKIVSLTLLWIAIFSSALFFTTLTWLRVLLFIIAIAVTLHTISFKTIKKH